MNIQVAVLCDAATNDNEKLSLLGAFESDRRDAMLRPSERYMACLIAGAEEHGLPLAWIERLRAVPARPANAAAAEWRPVFEEAMRRPRPEDER